MRLGPPAIRAHLVTLVVLGALLTAAPTAGAIGNCVNLLVASDGDGLDFFVTTGNALMFLVTTGLAGEGATFGVAIAPELCGIEGIDALAMETAQAAAGHNFPGLP